MVLVGTYGYTLYFQHAGVIVSYDFNLIFEIPFKNVPNLTVLVILLICILLFY